MVLDRGGHASLNPVDGGGDFNRVIGGRRRQAVGVRLGALFFSKKLSHLILAVVRELIVAKNEVGGTRVVTLDNKVLKEEVSLALGILDDISVLLAVAGDVVHEVEVFNVDGGDNGGKDTGSECGSHYYIIDSLVLYLILTI